MRLEFSADRVPGPRGSKTEYFLRKPRYRLVGATTGLTAITFLASSWMAWTTNRGLSIVALALGLLALIAAAMLWRKGMMKTPVTGLQGNTPTLPPGRVWQSDKST